MSERPVKLGGEYSQFDSWMYKFYQYLMARVGPVLSAGQLAGRYSGSGAPQAIALGSGLTLGTNGTLTGSTVTGTATKLWGVYGTGTVKQDIAVGAGLALSTDGTLSSSAAADLDKAYINGLKFAYYSASQFLVGPGAAYNQAVGGLVQSTATQTVSATGLSADTWYYVYMGTDASITYGTATPGSPYAGEARSLSTDTSQRFIGCVQTGTGTATATLEPHVYTLEGRNQRIAFNNGVTNYSWATNTSTTTGTHTLTGRLKPGALIPEKLFLQVVCQTGTSASQSRIWVPPATGGAYQLSLGNADVSQAILNVMDIALGTSTIINSINSGVGGSTTLYVLGEVLPR